MKNKYSVLYMLLLIGATVGCSFIGGMIPEDSVWSLLMKAVTLVMIVVTFTYIIRYLSAVFTAKQSAQKGKTQKALSFPQKRTVTELFAVLETEPILDVQVQNGDKVLNVGTSSDYRSPKFQTTDYFDKCYYIDDHEYTDFEMFKKAFLEIILQDEIDILFIGIDGNPISI